jgi:hypothetical protein
MCQRDLALLEFRRIEALLAHISHLTSVWWLVLGWYLDEGFDLVEDHGLVGEFYEGLGH